jgi:hypothetical protein
MARICRFAAVVPATRSAYGVAAFSSSASARCTPCGSQPDQNAMCSGVFFFGEVRSGSQLTPESGDGISTEYTFM